MQTLYVPKYGIHYRVNPKDPCELQWSKKPFGPLTSWQHAMTFKRPIRALDVDDETQQGVVVLNDSSTYVGSGVRVWGRKYYTAGSRIYSLYAIGESKMKNTRIETEKDPEWDKYYHDVKVFIGKHYIKNIVEWIKKRGDTIEDDEGNKFLTMVATYYDEERSVARAAKLLSDWVTTNDWQHTEFDDDPKSPLERQIMLFDKPSESKMKSKLKIRVHEKNGKANAVKKKLAAALKPLEGRRYEGYDWQIIPDFRGIAEPLLANENCGIELFCKDGGYRTSKDGLNKWKEYEFVVRDYDTDEEIINGKIICSPIGTFGKPFFRYETSIVMD